MRYLFPTGKGYQRKWLGQDVLSGVVIAADKLGKYKTATTMVSICGYLCVFAMTGLQLGPAELLLGVYGVSRFLYAVAVVLTVISGAQYFWNCRKIVFSV